MTSRDRLVTFVKDKMEESAKQWNGGLIDEASLLKSGLFDSLNLLELASWIETELDSAVDLRAVDLREECDTITDILNFIEKHRGR